MQDRVAAIVWLWAGLAACGPGASTSSASPSRRDSPAAVLPDPHIRAAPAQATTEAPGVPETAAPGASAPPPTDAPPRFATLSQLAGDVVAAPIALSTEVPRPPLRESRHRLRQVILRLAAGGPRWVATLRECPIESVPETGCDEETDDVTRCACTTLELRSDDRARFLLVDSYEGIADPVLRAIARADGSAGLFLAASQATGSHSSDRYGLLVEADAQGEPRIVWAANIGRDESRGRQRLLYRDANGDGELDLLVHAFWQYDEEPLGERTFFRRQSGALTRPDP